MSHCGQGSGGLLAALETPEQEKRRLKKELEKRGINEELSIDEMRSLLHDIITTEKTDEKTDLEQKKAERNASPVPLSPGGQQSYSDKLKLDNDRKSKSPDSPADQSSKILSREKHKDSSDDSIQGPNKMNLNRREIKDNSRTNANRGRRTEGRNDNKRILQKSDGRMKLDEKLSVLKLTSQDFDNDEQDRRLIPRYRLADKKSSQNENRMTKPSENERPIFDRLRKHLFRTAEICYNQRTSSLASNYQWGNAIKVDEYNASFEREILADEETTALFNDNINQPETSTSNSFAEETTRRRKRSTNMVAIYEFGDDDNEENPRHDDDEDFQLSVKRPRTVRSANQRKANSSKIGPKKKVESTATKQQSVESSFSAKESKDRPIFLDDWPDSDEAVADEISKKLGKSECDKTETFCPRRIVPPNPAGKKWAKIQARRPLYNSYSESRVQNPTENDGKSESAAGLQKSAKSSLHQDEIAKALEISDESDDNQVIIPLKSEIADVRPLKTSCRVKMQTQRLVKIHEEEKEKEAIHREEERIKEDIKLNEKSRRVAQRIREEGEKIRQQEAEEKRQAQREENWRNVMAQGSKQRFVERTELYPDGRPPQNEGTVNHLDKNNSPMELSDDEFITNIGNTRDNNSNRVSCPICNRRFDADDIEAHAGACEEYDSCPPGISRSSSPSLTPPRIPKTSRSRISITLECDVCQNFSTDNGKDFENHSQECIKRKKYGQPFTPDSVIQVSSSPIRSVRTISELSDSEINYKSQFEPKTKSNKTAKRGKRHL